MFYGNPGADACKQSCKDVHFYHQSGGYGCWYEWIGGRQMKMDEKETIRMSLLRGRQDIGKGSLLKTMC